jgi:hypothetical protein
VIILADLVSENKLIASAAEILGDIFSPFSM